MVSVVIIAITMPTMAPGDKKAELSSVALVEEGEAIEVVLWQVSSISHHVANCDCER